jgi:HD-GYP domain-containing protein (c-di-GMP phosphodiesterase class II)
LIGRWLKLPEQELRGVAVAGALHDVGKVKLPIEILNKPGTLTPEEFTVIRRHPALGHELLSAESGPDSLVARVALEHHERTDGSGYPCGLCSDRTLFASRIVAVADVYDAMISRRVYHDRLPEFAVLNQLQEDSFGHLDPLVTGTFLEHVAHNSRGRRVRLSNGQIGRVVFTRELFPDQPIVEVGTDLLDLADHPDLRLVDEVEEQ